jgi:hypothetical protein
VIISCGILIFIIEISTTYIRIEVFIDILKVVV